MLHIAVVNESKNEHDKNNINILVRYAFGKVCANGRKKNINNQQQNKKKSFNAKN